MPIDLERFTILFPDWFDDRAEFEHHLKGHLGDVIVQLEGGIRFKLYIMDPVRLSQDLEELSKAGRPPYWAEPNLVVVPEVTRDAIHKAVTGLLRDGFYEHLKAI